MTATERIAELLYRNLQEILGRVMRPAGAPPSKSSTQTTACSMFRTASSLDTPHWTNSPGNYARPIRRFITHGQAQALHNGGILAWGSGPKGEPARIHRARCCHCSCEPDC